MLPGGLLGLVLGSKDGGVGRYLPIGSDIEDEEGVRGGVKVEEKDEEYDDGGTLYSPMVVSISLCICR